MTRVVQLYWLCGCKDGADRSAFCGIRQGVCACGNTCASWSIAYLDSIGLGCVCALDRAAFESGMVSVWIDEGSNILRRCFAGKDRLYCLRVRLRMYVFSDVVLRV